MADFSAQTASLSDTSGAGANPVVTQINSQPMNPLPQAISELGQTLRTGVQAFMMGQQAEAKNAALGSIAREQAQINQALADGTYSPQEAHTRSMAAYNKAIAAYPSFANEIGQMHSVFKASTQIGDADDQIKQQREAAQKQTDGENQLMMSMGYHIPSDPIQRAAVLDAAEKTKQASLETERSQATFNLKKSQVGFDQEQHDREQRQQSITLINSLAGSNLDAFNATLQSLRDDVAAGRKKPEEAQMIWNTQYENINGPLQAAAGVNPELAAPYRSLFTSRFELGKQLLDPAKQSEELDRQLKDSITRDKLVLIADPQTKRLVSTSQLLGSNNPLLLATNATQTVKAMASITSTPVKNGVQNTFVPQVAGNPEIEGDALKALKFGIDQMRGGKYADAMAAGAEGSNAVNNLLVQTGHLMNQGVTPDRLKGMAEFFGSPQYAYMVQHGMIDGQAAQTAKKTLQAIYEPAVVQAVGSKLQGNVPGGNTKLSDAVDVQFNGAGATFVLKKGLSPDQIKQAQPTLDGLRSAQQGLNTLVHIGAHMEGTTDYQKYWEENKSVLLPQVYPVKPGQVVNGFKYSGNGDWRDKSNWTKVADGGK